MSQSINNTIEQSNPNQINYISRRRFFAFFGEFILIYGTAGLTLKAITYAQQAQASTNCNVGNNLNFLLFLLINFDKVKEFTFAYNPALTGNIANISKQGNILTFAYNPALTGNIANISKQGNIFTFAYNPALAGNIVNISKQGNIFTFAYNPALTGNITNISKQGNIFTFAYNPALTGNIANIWKQGNILTFTYDPDLTGNIAYINFTY